MNDAEALGQRLRETREARELTLEEAARQTRIRIRFLESLESGDYAGMTAVQAQGFLRNYARFLGQDFDLLLAEVQGERGGRRRLRISTGRREESAESETNGSARPDMGAFTQSAMPRPAPLRRESTRTSRARRSFVGNILIIVIAGAVVIGLIIGGVRLLDEMAEQQTTSTSEDRTPSPAPTQSEMALEPGTEPASPAVETPTPMVTPSSFTPPVLIGPNVTVAIEIIQTAWVSISTDGIVQYEGTAKSGDILNFTGQQSVSVRTDNAAGVQLTVNNQPQGVLGARGQLFDYTFTLANFGTPIPTLPGLPSDALDTGLLPAATSAETVAVLVPTAPPTEAALFFTGSPTLPLDPGDLSVLDSISQTPAEVTASPAPTETAIPTLPSATSEPTETAIPTLLPASPEPTLFETETPTEAVSFTPPPTMAITTAAPLTRTPSPTPTTTATLTPTLTVTPSATPTPTATRTLTRTATYTPTVTPSFTLTRTPTATFTPTPTWSSTPSLTPTNTPFLPPRMTRTPSPAPK